MSGVHLYDFQKEVLKNSQSRKKVAYFLDMG